LLTRLDASGPRRASERPPRLLAVRHDRAPPVTGSQRAQPQLRGVSLDPRRRARRGHHDARRALGAQAPLGHHAHRDTLALQREVLPRVAAALPRVPRGGVVRPRRGLDAACRVDHRAPDDRQVLHERPLEPTRHRRARVLACPRAHRAMRATLVAVTATPFTENANASSTIAEVWRGRMEDVTTSASRRASGSALRGTSRSRLTALWPRTPASSRSAPR